MKTDKLTTALYEKMCQVLDRMKADPDSITDKDRDILSKLYSKICKPLGISEHSRWEVQWRVEKWADTARKLAGFAPDEVCVETQNIIVNTGAEELLKIITNTGGTAFGSNSYIYVGNSATNESATQTGLLGASKASARMDSGYPTVSGRAATYRATFGDTQANFDWREIGIANGNNNPIFMNRKQANLGTKNNGTWTIQVILNLVSA